MKHLKLLGLSLISLLTLTSCGDKAITKEEYDAYIDECNEVIATDIPTNIHINDYSKTNVYDYVEGEYYSYRMFALIIFVPVTQGKYVWKDGDHYYKAETHTDSSKNTKSEIDEETFNILMAGYKESLRAMLLSYANEFKNLEEDENHVELTKNYYSLSNGVKGTASYTDYNGVTKRVTSIIKNNYPVKYVTKDKDGTSGQYFDYGKASFTEPTINSEA